MAEKDDGGGAFPQVDSEVRGSGCAAYAVTYSYGGMTLRDYFAGQVIGALSARACSTVEGDTLRAYRIADAMLKARERHDG